MICNYFLIPTLNKNDLIYLFIYYSSTGWGDKNRDFLDYSPVTLDFVFHQGCLFKDPPAYLI